MGKFNLLLFFYICLLFIQFPHAEAADILVQGRLFAGSTKMNPAELNTELTAQSLKTVDSITGYGVEITYPVLGFVDAGMRYTHRNFLKDEDPSNESTEYKATLDQDSVLLLARVPLLKTTFFRLDIFAGAGGSNTGFKIKTTGQDGELTKKEGGDWFASPTYSYGASVGLGYKWIFLTVEGGYEANKIDSFKRVGTINSNVQAIDMSGGYVLVGLMFDGVPGKFK